jgi:hypothetical protein
MDSFEKWYLQEKGEKPSFNRDHNGSSQWDGDKYDAQMVWQASAELSDSRIAELEAKLALAIEALEDVRRTPNGNTWEVIRCEEALAKIRGE